MELKKDIFVATEEISEEQNESKNGPLITTPVNCMTMIN